MITAVVSAKAITDPDLSALDFRLYAYLRMRTEQGEEDYPESAETALLLGISEEDLAESLSKLLQKGIYRRMR